MFSKTALISGAGGFLGRALLQQLSQKPTIRVMALTSKPEELRSLFHYMGNLTCYSSVEDLDSGAIPFEEVDFLIHSAFSRTVDYAPLAASLEFTSRLLWRAALGGVKGIVNISSQSVYGRNRDVPWDESSALDVDSPYAFAKFASELLTQAVADGTGVAATSLRLAALTGPGADSRFISVFVKNALAGNPIKVIGGEQVFSFMDVNDAAAGIIRLVDIAPSKWRRVYNLGGYWTHTLTELAEMVRRIAEDYVSLPVTVEVESGGDARDARMSSRLFYSDTRWQPTRDPERIIRTLFEHYIRSSSTAV